MATDKKLVALSNYDRLHNVKFSRKTIKIDPTPCSLPVEVQEVKDGVVYRRTEYREYDNHANDNFKVSDFCLENIIAVGKTDLNPTVLERDSLSANDMLASQIDNLNVSNNN